MTFDDHTHPFSLGGKSDEADIVATVHRSFGNRECFL